MARLTIYRSSDPNGPVLDGQVGSLVALLDACLVNGYTASVTSITRSGGTATVITPVPHNLIEGQLVTIAGAAETDYNGTFGVSILSGVSFTYVVPGAPATPATGSITYLRIAAGWTKPFTGTNKAAFKQGSGSNEFYVRVQDDAPGAGGAREARVVGYETMVNVDTGTDLFPTAVQFANGLFVRKSSTADATARTWILFADARTFYLYVLSAGADVTPTAYRAFCFGEFYSLKAGDPFRCFIAARNSENNTAATSDTLDLLTTIAATSAGNFIARGHNETAGAVNIGKHADNAKCNSSVLGIGFVPYTNPANGAFYLSRVWIHDPTTTPVSGVRGRMRGLWAFLHPVASVIDGDILIGSGELVGKTFLVVKSSGTGGLYIMETSDTVESN